MMRLLVACALTLLASVAGTFAAVDYWRGHAVETERFKIRRLRSGVLGESRELLVHLPESYLREPERRYGVVYVLDGSSLDGPTADSAALMARLGVTPELLVVGIPNVSGEGRQRDYTPPFMRQDADDASSPMGRADRFLVFLEREVVPLVERDYRIGPTRILSGHSRGGLFVPYALMERPWLFDGYLAHSPAVWRDDGVLVSRLDEWLGRQTLLDRFVYISVGADEVPRMTDGFRRLRATFECRAAMVGLAWASDVVAGADHQANGRFATPLGLKAFFDSNVAE